MTKKLLAACAASTILCAGLALGQGKGDAAKGKALFEEKAEPACSMCHNADSAEKKMGPGLKGLAKKAKLNNGKKPSDAALKDLILKGGGGMPGYEETLKGPDVENLIAYLRTL
jgi:mono/diheme cytochrome c family protein